MPTTTQTKPTLGAPFEQLEELGEQILTASRTAGSRYLDSYEKAVDRAVEVERKLAEASNQEWLKTLADTHVEVTRELTGAYMSTARQLLGE